MRSRWRAVVIAVLVLGAWTELAQATEEVVVQVAQPVWAQGDWFLAMTAYVDMQGSRVPGYNLGLITRPNRMPVREEFEQRNAAYDQGIEIRTDTGGGNAGLYGDTLRAELDLTHLKKPTDPYGAEIEPDLIRKTVDSILVTAI